MARKAAGREEDSLSIRVDIRDRASLEPETMIGDTARWACGESIVGAETAVLCHCSSQCQLAKQTVSSTTDLLVLRISAAIRVAPDNFARLVFLLERVWALREEIVRAAEWRVSWREGKSIIERQADQFAKGQSPLLEIAIGMEKPSTLLASSRVVKAVRRYQFGQW